jgi:hypothetical protein
MNTKHLTIILICSLSIIGATSFTKLTKTISPKANIPGKLGDANFRMNAASWRGYSYKTRTMIDSGATRYFTTPEGVKAVGQSYRLGIRLQTVSEINFANKFVYWKWKGNGGGSFASFVPQIKYDPTSSDGNPALMGVDLAIFHMNGPLDNSTMITEDTWYYTRMAPIAGTDNYEIVTSAGNYHNKGGTVISRKKIPVYTKSGYIGIRMGDCFGSTRACMVFGECRVASK